MTVRLLKTIRIGGVETAVGSILTLTAEKEQEFVTYGLAEFYLAGIFSTGGQQYSNGAAHVTVVATAASAGALESRYARFDAVADMPADITNSANVAAKRIKFDTFNAAARKIRLIWHGAALAGPDTQGTQAFFGEIAAGALITFNAPDDATANLRLTYSDLTGGGTSSAGKPDTVMVGKHSGVIEMVLSEGITRIDAIGIPNGLTATELDKLLPCFLEVQVLG